jgi:hypothetical protein
MHATQPAHSANGSVDERCDECHYQFGTVISNPWHSILEAVRYAQLTHLHKASPSLFNILQAPFQRISDLDAQGQANRSRMLVSTEGARF